MTSIAGAAFVFASSVERADMAPNVGELVGALHRRGVARKALYCLPGPAATYATARCDALDPAGPILPAERGFETDVLLAPAGTPVPVLLRDAPFDLSLRFQSELPDRYGTTTSGPSKRAADAKSGRAAPTCARSHWSHR